MADTTPGPTQGSVPDPLPETRAIVAAFAVRAKLTLSEAERQRLEGYVAMLWDMTDRLRNIVTPGYEGMADRLPLAAAHSNRGPSSGSSASSSTATSVRPTSAAVPGAPQPLPDHALDGGVISASRAIAAGEYSPLDLVNGQLERITRHDATVRSYITVDGDGALAAASELTAELGSSGPRSILHGIPFGAKDTIPAAGMPCTYNSRLTKDWMPKRDAEAVRRLRAAGAVLVGKHNVNEFAWSQPREDDLFPPPRNPWLPEEYAVGSTSGGGAALSARLAMFALGTDGGGSTRLPAGQNLLFGLKPGHRRIPPEGVTESRITEVGVLARRAEDVAAVLAALLIDPDGEDAEERLRREPTDRVAYVGSAPMGLRIAVPDVFLEEVGIEPDIHRAFEATLRAIEELGHEIVHLPRRTLSILRDGVRANFLVIAAEHHLDHEGPGKNRNRYGASAGFNNLPGACLTAVDYLHALRVGELIRQQVDEVLGDADFILTPTSPVTRTSSGRDPEVLRRGGNAAYTAPFSISGHPGVSLPVGLSDEGLPIGMQLIGRAESEFELLRAGRAISGAFELPALPDLEQRAVQKARSSTP